MSDVSSLKQRFVIMLVGDAVLMMIAVAFAVAHFSYSVGWAVWGFAGFLAAAFVLQLWFIRGFARTSKGG
ncbi:MAG TPA: hypothetical protein VGC92_12655 [Phenylobacterium sp.]|jgi:hypothetical protein